MCLDLVGTRAPARARERRCLVIRALEQNHYRGIGFPFVAGAQQIEHEHNDEHEHDPSKLWNLEFRYCR
jgi:hypothetical protein